MIALPEKVSINLRTPTDISAINSGSFVGATASPRADGTLVASEVHIFPESMRGTGEGHRPMEGANTMTNATNDHRISRVAGVEIEGIPLKDWPLRELRRRHTLALVDHMLRRFTRIVRGMVVYPERMRENLNRSRGVVFSGSVLLEFMKKGVSREDAYAIVQANAMKVWRGEGDFLAFLKADPQVANALSPAELEASFDLDHHLKHVDTIFARVFGAARS